MNAFFQLVLGITKIKFLQHGNFHVSALKEDKFGTTVNTFFFWGGEAI